MGIFIIAFSGIVIGIILILLLKNASPPRPQEQIHFENPEDKPKFLLDREVFKAKCIEFLEKFNLEYKHSIWADDNELEIALEDETPVVGGIYLALAIFEPLNNTVNLHTVTGFFETVKGEDAARGIIITTGYFSNDAIRAIEDDRIELVNIVSFISYLKKFGIYDN